MVLAVLIVLVVLVGTGVWTIGIPRYRPDLNVDERYGIDVSHHQGEIDWEAVAGDDIDFAYIKATEGGDHVDARFAENWAGATNAGLEVGAYHFFTFCRPGAEQAENFLSVAPDDPDALPPVIDLELAGNCEDRPSRDDIRREVDAFISTVEAAIDQPVVLYIGDDFEGFYELRDDIDRPVWHRRLYLRPDIGDWWMWQLSYRAEIDGIDGGVDLNVMSGPAPRR